jgi:hypothetical protein
MWIEQNPQKDGELAARYLEDLKRRADFSSHPCVARIVLRGGAESLLWIKYFGLLEKRNKELAGIRDSEGFCVLGGSHRDRRGFGLSYIFCVSGTKEKKLRFGHGTIFMPASGYEVVAEDLMLSLVEEFKSIAESDGIGFELKVERTIR